MPGLMRPHSVKARSLFLPTLWLSLAPRSQAPGISGGKRTPGKTVMGHRLCPHTSLVPHPFGCLRTFECAVSDTLNVSASPPLCLLLPIHTVHTWGRWSPHAGGPPKISDIFSCVSNAASLSFQAHTQVANLYHVCNLVPHICLTPGGWRGVRTGEDRLCLCSAGVSIG